MDTAEDIRRRKYDEMYFLIRKRNLVKVQNFVKKENINSEEYYNLWRRYSIHTSIKLVRRDPLRLAALVNAPAIVRYLISLGFDPNAGHLNDIERPIHAACKTCDRRLEDIGGARDTYQSRADNLEVVTTLLDHDVDVNVVNTSDDGFTPLLYAASEDRLEIAKLLVKAGADINARSRYRESVLHAATGYGSPELCQYFISLGLKVDDANKWGNVPLFGAVEHDKTKVAEVLLKAGADVNWRDISGLSHLGHAIKNKRLDMVQLLHAYGANSENDEDYFLHEAVRGHANDIVRYLVVEKGASLNSKDFTQNTPFSVAMKTGNMEVATILISSGCRIDISSCLPENIAQSTTSYSPDEWETFVKDVQQMSANPRRLLEISCFTIRALLGKNIEESVAPLSIPNFLKNVLLLKHV